MSTCFSRRVAVTNVRVLLFGVLLSGMIFSASSVLGQLATKEDSGQTRMLTFDSASETNFALSVQADFDNQPQRSTDLVVYVDTSASQTGVFREDSIVALETLLSNLNADDRVTIMAVDLDPVPLTDKFVRPDSQDAKSAIERLRARSPLGSTDMKLMLKEAPDQFESAVVRNRNVVYIGDGISRAGIVHSDALEGIVKRLVRNQISVSSFAIGPDRNMELLAILANHTGGNLYIDSDLKGSPEAAALSLAETVHGSVFWPQIGAFTDSVVETFPTAFPPLREDRDSIVLGTVVGSGEVELKVTGKLNGRRAEKIFEIRPEVSSKQNSFLPKMVRDSRKDGGLSLPTAGSSGLIEYARVLGFRSDAIAGLGKQALEEGDLINAQRLAAAAMIVDPENNSAKVLAKSTSYVAKKRQDDSPFGGDDLFGEQPADSSPADSSPFDGAEAADAFEPSTAPGEAPVPSEPSQIEAPSEDQGDIFGEVEDAPAG